MTRIGDVVSFNGKPSSGTLYDYPQFETNTQLKQIVSEIKYKAGWKFRLRDDIYYTQSYIEIQIECIDSLTGNPTTIIHTNPIPNYPNDDEKFWRRWLLDRIFDIEKHEAMEFFQIGDSRPFFPDHKGNPYAIRESC